MMPVSYTSIIHDNWHFGVTIDSEKDVCQCDSQNRLASVPLIVLRRTSICSSGRKRRAVCENTHVIIISNAQRVRAHVPWLDNFPVVCTHTNVRPSSRAQDSNAVDCRRACHSICISALHNILTKHVHMRRKATAHSKLSICTCLLQSYRLHLLRTVNTKQPLWFCVRQTWHSKFVSHSLSIKTQMHSHAHPNTNE